ncbi:hypothetical protein [Henriciella litoralis]|uniref:hypothetical protein n=1 Tax=Henriciella litoralis TaxID=568102 RepID=UPI00111C7AF0|nr:hypothetical protein [Henriciella litoralis]
MLTANLACMSPFDPFTLRAIERAWPLLIGLGREIAGLTGKTERGVHFVISRHKRNFLLRLLCPAEALLRRLIMAMAINLLAEKKVRLCVRPPAAKPNLVAPRAKRAAREASVRNFSLNEPVPSLASCIGAPGPNPFKRGNPRILDLSKPYPVLQVTTDTAPRPPRLEARINAFLARLEKPAPAAEKLARAILRFRAAPPGKRKRGPIRPGLPPGLRSQHVPRWLAEILRHLSVEIRRADPRFYPPDHPLFAR